MSSSVGVIERATHHVSTSLRTLTWVPDVAHSFSPSGAYVAEVVTTWLPQEVTPTHVVNRFLSHCLLTIYSRLRAPKTNLSPELPTAPP
jgi:hypothetical protein